MTSLLDDFKDTKTEKVTFKKDAKAEKKKIDD
jgi:hypothetical protein